jgi:hypothetical protein
MNSNSDQPTQAVKETSRFKKSYLAVLLGLAVPITSFATTHYCIAVNSGFGKGGTTFVGINFTVPSSGACSPWSGFTKTASTVVLTTIGTGCLSSDGKVFTLAASSFDPDFLGDSPSSDYIEFCVKSGTCPIGSGRDISTNFGGPAAEESCTSAMESLPSSHA